MKKYWSMTVFAVLCISLCVGCGAAGKKEKQETGKTIKIGISVYNQYDTFVSELMEQVSDMAKEKEKSEQITISIEIQNAGSSQMTQNDQVANFVENGCDIICVNLVDRTDASTVIETGKSAGIPIIFFNRELVEEDLERWNGLYYVGAEAFQSGNLQGEILVDLCRDDFDTVDKNKDGILQYVMLEGEAGHQDSIVRTLSVINKVTESGIQVEKLADEIANWNRDQGYSKMSQWLKTMEGKIEVCIANNDDMALGAVDALEDAGYKPEDGQWPVILGIDGTKAGMEAVERGKMAGTVLNDSKGQAQGMVALACHIVLGTDLPGSFELLDKKYIRLPYEKVTR